MQKLKVAAIQFPLSEAINQKEFFDKVESFIDQSLDCDLIVFPELFSTEIIKISDQDDYHTQLKNHSINFTPLYITWLKTQCLSKKINILGGTVPRLVKDKIYNTAVLGLASGEILLQDKIYLTPDEKSWRITPGRSLNIFETPLGKLVVTICFDSEIPELSNLLVLAQPEVILIPSWTSTKSGLNRVEWAARARAVEHYAYVIKTAIVPVAGTTSPFGQASIISPQETGFPTAIIKGPLNEPAVVKGELDLELLRSMRQQSGYYPAHEQTIRLKRVKLKK